MITDKFFEFLRQAAEGVSQKNDGIPHWLWCDDLFELAGIGLWIFDAQGKTAYVNHAIASRLGYSREEMLALPMVTFTGQKTLELAQWYMRRRKQGVAESHEARLIDRDGCGVWVYISSVPMFDKGETFLGVACILTDITERKRQEQSLRESEERYRLILENIQDGYFECDLAGRITFCNEAFSRIHGYSREACHSTDYRDYLTPENAQLAFQAFNQVYLTGDPLPSLEVEVIKPDGGRRYLDEFVSLIRDAQGRAVGFRGIVCDTTGRRLAEDAIHDSEERFRTLAETASDAILTIDESGKIVFANQAIQQVFGHSSNEIIGKDLVTLMPESMRHLHTAGISHYQQTGQKHIPWTAVELPGLHRHGHEVPLEISFGEFTNNGQQYFTGIARDISKRKRSETLIEGQVKVLEMIATGAPLKETLEVLIHLVEKLFEKEIGSILLLDEERKHLRHGAALSLPEEYVRAIDGIAIGPRVGSYGTAAYTGQIVIVADIAQDPLWQEYRNLALSHGLRACWSVPIFSTARQVLGTFAIYSRTASSPEPEEVKLIETLANLASIAIERFQSEAKLLASEARFRAVTEKSGEGISLILPDATLIYASPSITQILGYTPADILGSKVDARIHPDDSPRFKELLYSLSQTAGSNATLSYRSLHRDGHWRWIEAAITNLLHEPSVQGIVVNYRDMTERKQAEEALMASEERYRSLVAALDEGIVLQDENSLILAANASAERVLGLTSDQLMGRTSYDPEWRAVQEDGLPFPGEQHPGPVTLQTGKPCSNVVMGVHKPDGRLTWISINSQPLLRPGETKPYAVVCSFGDISQRKLAEDALRSSEERFAKAFSASPQPMVIFEAFGRRIVSVNEAMVRTFGWQGEEMLGKTPADLNFWADLKQQSRVRALLAEQGFVRDLEIQFRTKSGEVRDFLYSAETVTLDNLLHVLVVVSDITERKMIEQELAQSYEQLRSLSARVEKVREEERTRIAREIHDNLGQALTGLKMDFSWLDRSLSRTTDEMLCVKAKPKLKEIAQLLEETIQTVRDIATDLRPGVLDTLGLCAAIDWHAHGFGQRSGIKCSTHLCREPQKLPVDRSTALFRIFQEILTNTARHSKATQFSVKVVEAGSNLVLTVQDDGIGIAEEQMRSPKSLGLIGMRERVLAFGGSLQIVGSPQRGTTVTVTMPVCE
ncbi:MAG: PAS domain S-box protein [Blastocatellia bacterium]